MKVCVLTRTTPFHHIGGMEDHIKTLYEGIAARGITVHVITTAHPEGKEHEAAGCLEYFFIKGTKPGAYSNAWWSKSTKKFVEHNDIHHYDVIHSQSAGGYSLLKSGLPKKLGIPVVATFHGTAYEDNITRLNTIRYRKGRVSSLDKFLADLDARRGNRELSDFCKTADKIIAPTDERERILREVFGAPKERIELIYHGMKLDLFAPGMDTKDLRERLRISPEDRIILCMARLEIDKGVQFTIEAMPEVLKEFKSVKLVITGDGNYKKALENKAKDLKIRENVIFTGSVPFSETNRYFNLCDIFSNYSFRFTGYDLTMLEAMACAKPVIAADYGSNPTLIENGKSGILLPVWRADLLAPKIIDILKNDPQRNSLGTAARVRALEKFSARKMIEDTLRLYERLAKGRVQHGR